MEALNIQGNDLEAYVKANQFVPSFAQGVFDYEWDLRDKNHAVLTVRHCPAFAGLRGEPEKLNRVCQVLEHAAIKAYTEVIDLPVQLKPLRAGVSGEPNEIACQWEFKVE